MASPGTQMLHVTAERLGQGTSASVHIAHLDGRLVAAKLSGPRESARRQCRREARRYRRFRAHRGITRCLGVGEDAGTVVLVTELMTGGSLFEALGARTAPPPLRTVLRLGADVADAVGFLHREGYSCGDVKSLNVLLSAPLDARGQLPPGACAKLCDFGLSRRLRPGAADIEPDTCGPASMFATTADTDPAALAGTFAYLPPEAFDTPPRTPDALVAADVYALAVVLWEIATAQVPWKGRSLGELMRALRARKTLPWPRAARDAVGEEYVKLVERCWAADPTRRPPASYVVRALRQMMENTRAGDGFDDGISVSMSFSGLSELSDGNEDEVSQTTFESEDSGVITQTITEIDSEEEEDGVEQGSFDISISLFHQRSSLSPRRGSRRTKFTEIDSPVEMSGDEEYVRLKQIERVYEVPPLSKALERELAALEQADISEALLWSVMKYGDD